MTDQKAPNVPNVTTEGLNVSMNSTDNGTTYTYYVQTISTVMWGAGTTRNSEEVSQTITSGLFGYYYVVDSNATNDFNISSAH